MCIRDRFDRVGHGRRAVGIDIADIVGIQTGVAIGFFVRNPKRDGCGIHYLTLDDFLTAMEKRRWLAANSLRQLARAGEFARVRPNERGDWINQPTTDWSAFLPVADKAVKAGQSEGCLLYTSRCV